LLTAIKSGSDNPTDVTVPPVPLAVNVVPLRLRPLPNVISSTDVVVLELPSNLPVVLRSCILLYVTELLAIVVAREPAVVVTSPVNAGNLPAASVPVTFVPERSIAFAVIS